MVLVAPQMVYMIPRLKELTGTLQIIAKLWYITLSKALGTDT